MSRSVTFASFPFPTSHFRGLEQGHLNKRAQGNLALSLDARMPRSLFQDYSANNGDGKRKEQDTFHHMEETTRNYLSKMEADSVLFANGNDGDGHDHYLRPIPQFEPDEIQLETMVGMGEFGILLKVKGICLTEGEEDKRMETNSGSIGPDSAQTVEGRYVDPKLQQQQHYPSTINLPSHDTTKNQYVIPGGTSLASSGAAVVQHTFRDANSEMKATVCQSVMMSQSITIAKLASPTLPIAERMGVTYPRRRPSVLSPDQEAMINDASKHQSVRRSLAAQANSTQILSTTTGGPSTVGPSIVVSGASRFVIKQIRKDLYPKKKIEAAKDLAREAKFLARLDHPNIVALRGLVSQAGNPEFGILLDRLRITLSEELSMWHQREEEIAASSSSRISLLSPVEVLAASIKASWPFFPQQQTPQRQTADQESDPMHDQHHRRTSSYNDHSEQQRLSSGNVFDIPEACWLLGERVLALYDVSQAMYHLHQFKILFRDLKTENVGALGDHRMQIFDFGLAKECKPVDRWDAASIAQQGLQKYEGTSQQDRYKGRQRGIRDAPNEFTMGLPASCSTSSSSGSTDPPPRIDEDDDEGDGDELCEAANPDCDREISFSTSYQMTGLTGTLRVMAPEVIQCLPYGLPADVYSFGICMWEVFSGERSSSLTAADVCKGVRPPIPKFEKNQGVGMPPRLQELLLKCWAADSRGRPDFGHVRLELERQLVDLRHHQEALQARHGKSNSRSASCNTSRDNSPQQGRHRHQEHHSKDGSSAAAAQAAFWNRLETIRPFQR